MPQDWRCWEDFVVVLRKGKRRSANQRSHRAIDFDSWQNSRRVVFEHLDKEAVIIRLSINSGGNFILVEFAHLLQYLLLGRSRSEDSRRQFA